MSNIDNITYLEFMALFSRDFPYLPLYQVGKTYFIDDVVYYQNNFYQSKIDNNTSLPTVATNWKLINESKDNFVSANDINRAFDEAKINFNADLFKDDATAKLVFLYLAAHYLVIDLTNAQSPLSSGLVGFTQSKSVGSVSESYAIPQWMQNSKILGMYAQTGYGRKYLSLIQPFLIGNIIYTPGATTNG